MLIQNFFDEKLVFKIQTKIERLLEHYYENIIEGDKNANDQFALRAFEILDQYNTVVMRNTNIDIAVSQPNSIVEVVQVDAQQVDLNQLTGDIIESTTDKNDIFYQNEKRQQRLFIVELIVMFSVLVIIGLGALDILEQTKVK